MNDDTRTTTGTRALLPTFQSPLLVAALVVSVAFAPAEHTHGAEKPAFRAGAAAVDITPEHLPVSMTGSFQDRKALAVHDRLHARGLVLDDEKTRVAIVVVDSCLLSREIFDEAKRRAAKATGIPAKRMLCSATHTHTAPTAISLAQCEADPRYVEQLTRQIAEAVVEANGALQPAEIGWGVAREPTEVFNRRWKMKPGTIPANPLGGTDDKVKMNPPRGSANLVEPAGPIDPEVSVLAVRTADGKPLALLANYSLHYVGGIPGQQLSADYFGEFARQIAERLEAEDSSFVGMLSNGTSGDINNIDFRNPRPASEPFERVKIVAGKVADAALEAWHRIEFRDHVPLAMVEREIELGVRKPSPEEVVRAKEILTQVEGDTLRTLPEVYAQETVILADHPGTERHKLQALRIGELAITAIPCEVFVEIGLELKQRSPFETTFTIELANGYGGYLPTPEQHELVGYETWRSRWSYLEVRASRKITAQLVELLADLRRSDR